MVSGCGFHHLHCIDVELIVHNLVWLYKGLLSIYQHEWGCVLLKNCNFENFSVTFRFLIVVSTEIAWAVILLKTLFSTVSLALLVSLHLVNLGEPPRFGFLEKSWNSVTTAWPPHPQPWLRKDVMVEKTTTFFRKSEIWELPYFSQKSILNLLLLIMFGIDFCITVKMLVTYSCLCWHWIVDLNAHVKNAGDTCPSV